MLQRSFNRYIFTSSNNCVTDMLQSDRWCYKTIKDVTYNQHVEGMLRICYKTAFQFTNLLRMLHISQVLRYMNVMLQKCRSCFKNVNPVTSFFLCATLLHRCFKTLVYLSTVLRALHVSYMLQMCGGDVKQPRKMLSRCYKTAYLNLCYEHVTKQHSLLSKG